MRPVRPVGGRAACFIAPLQRLPVFGVALQGVAAVCSCVFRCARWGRGAHEGHGCTHRVPRDLVA